MDLGIGDRLGRGVGAGIADGAQGLSDGGALEVSDGEHLVEVEEPGVDGAAHDRRGEATAFLVEPVDDGEVEGGLQTGFDEFLFHPQGREEGGDDSVGSVEATAERLRIEVRADEDIRGIGNELEAGEHVADRIHAHVEALVRRPAAHPVTRLLVLLCQRLPVDAVVVGRADGGDEVEVCEERCVG